MFSFLGAILFIVVIVLLLVSLARVSRLTREIELLKNRFAHFERDVRGANPPAAAPSPAEPIATLEPEEEETIASSDWPPAAPATGVPEAWSFLAPPVATLQSDTAAHAPPPSLPSTAPPPTAPVRDLEQLVGGVWLQNAGSVVVLVGVFFLILWGWTTGRFGPGVLVAAGVGLGLGVAWRGDRTRRGLPGIGHALIGVGLGIIYLSLYLGHFTLRVLPAPLAFASLLAASGLAVYAGLHYRVQTIATIGVIGAFLPQALAAFLPLHGFSMAPEALLGYLAAVDVLVFALAFRAGWSGLALAAVLLTAATWIAGVPADRWSWPLELGLAGLFTALGLAPLPRLVRAEGTVRPQDLAVIAATPLAFVACSWPMWSLAQPLHVALLLFALAAVQIAAALWVDARRPERDLWRPLTGAATVFIAAALQRSVGTSNTPLAWILEGVVLTTLGLAPRGGWIRLCGHVVAATGGFWLLINLAGGSNGSHPLPVWNAEGLRDGVAIAALLFGGFRLHAARERVERVETALALVWVWAANLMLMFWFWREADHLAWSLEGNGGRWRSLPRVEAAPGHVRYAELQISLVAVAWMTQAALLIRSSLRSGWPLLRVSAHVVAGCAALPLIWTAMPDGWGRDLLPVVHRDGLLFLIGLLIPAAVAFGLASRRSSLAAAERFTPEVWAAGAAFALLMWISREADHVARVALDLPGELVLLRRIVHHEEHARLRALVPTLTSVGWLAQALVTLAFGWWRRSAFLRWMGLVLVGVTVLKVLFLDLSGADPFWRFLAAIVTGVAMLSVSYLYQRRKSRQRDA